MCSDPKRSSWKGFTVGALGGLAASFAMGQFHQLFYKAEASSLPAEEDSTVKAAAAISRSIFHHKLTPEQKKIAGPAMHYGFGASVAALYGVAAEFNPLVRAGWGIPFGAAVWLGAHVIAVPALGMSAPISKSTTRQEATELGAHLVYGAVVEGVRRLLRRSLLR